MVRQTMSVGSSAARFLEGLVRPGTRASAPSARSILVLEYMLPLGSCVHMTPLYEALKRHRPGSIITVATRGLGLQVLRHSPFVDHLLETPNPIESLRAAANSLSAQLNTRSIQPDCCLTGIPDQRTAIALLAILVCRGWRGGYTVHPSLYHHPMQEDVRLSQIESNLRLATLIGASSQVLEPRVFYTAADIATARALIAPTHETSRPLLVVVSQTSGGQQTGWRRERWIATLQHAHEALGYSILFVGTSGEASSIAALQHEAGGIGLSIAGKTTVNELAAVLASSDLVLSLDTGTMHVGRAVGVPMIVLGPSWQKPHEWLPLGKPHVRILRGQDRTAMPEGYQLDEISAEAVTGALDEMTALYPADEAARAARLAAGLSEIDLLRR